MRANLSLTARGAALGATTLLATSVALAAGAPVAAPQVLLAITNSESMDGTTSGAIMTGSGMTANSSALSGSSSPTSYTPDSGFTPPVNTGSGTTAPYTASCASGNQCDNSQSRLNMTKGAIQGVLHDYGTSLNFGVYTYASSSGGKPSPTLYTTWVYYMSPSSSNFTYTNTASSTTVANPCYNYSASSSSTVKSNCGSIATTSGTGVDAATLGGSKYINIGATSDNPQINDVLYAGSNLNPVFLTYGTVTPANPYTTYSLSTYNTNIGSYSASYSKQAPSMGGWSTTPTNAGYIPFSSQVYYAQRGWGYGGSQSATTGYATVAMSTDPTGTTFQGALAAETNSTSTSEIKSFAGQSGIYALMNGAYTYLDNFKKSNSAYACVPQYVVLLTDGLPTMDSKGSAWPPLGTVTANAYNLTATYAADKSYVSSNSNAVDDAITSIKKLAAAGIKVYVIGLGAGVDSTVNPQAASLLTAMALAGGTSKYYAATDPNSLKDAFSTIIGQIYSESALSAPVAPISVSNGSSFEYELTTVTTPKAGHVKAYAAAANGTLANTESWDAGKNMTATDRTGKLKGPMTDGTFATLGNLDTPVWNLTKTTCVPAESTIISYTIDPSYSGVAGCDYLQGRQPNWDLGGFSTQNTGRYVAAPASSLLLQKYPTYQAYVRSSSARVPMLMFTNDDGFLYSLTAATGDLRWAIAPRRILAMLQDYVNFQKSNATDGNFTVVDAMDASGTWASYVVGSYQGGAEHYIFRLASDGSPSQMIYDSYVAGGTSAGDARATTVGSAPLRQPPVVVYIGNSAYVVYVVTVGTVSTLYETNVATGATTSSPLAFQVSSALSVDLSNNRLWLGASAGTLWNITLGTGAAAADAASVVKVGTLVNPSSGATVANPLYVGYSEVGGVPHFYAVGSAVLEMFYVTSAGWTPEWGATTSANYKYSASTWTPVSGGATLTPNSFVSDFPVTIGSALLVPVFVPPATACDLGTGWYDFFGLDSGQFPIDPVMTQNGQRVTANYKVGIGPAFSPSVTFTTNGIVMNNGSQGCTQNCGSTQVSATYPTTPFSWRQH